MNIDDEIKKIDAESTALRERLIYLRGAKDALIKFNTPTIAGTITPATQTEGTTDEK